LLSRYFFCGFIIFSDYWIAIRGIIEKVKRNKKRDCWRNISCEGAVEIFLQIGDKK
jgi:hypothetical protein